MTEYESFVARGKAKHGTRFSTADLARQFIPAFNNRKRIRVQFSGSPKIVLSGRVGVTTGWKPVFLLMARRDSLGSSDTLGPADKIVPDTTPIKRY